MEKQSASPVAQNLAEIRQKVVLAAEQAGRDVNDIQLMAVTKTVDPEWINQAIDQGVNLLGENRVQEFLQKQESYQLDRASVHFIGQLQTNKVKYIIDKVAMIQSVSSIKLAKEIQKQAQKHDLVMDILLEINIGREESKSGFDATQIGQVIDELDKMPNICVRGLMCIPPKEDAKRYFSEIYQLFIDINSKKSDNSIMDVLSMGMSGDYETAIAYGATIIRLGTALFGKRDYQI